MANETDDFTDACGRRFLVTNTSVTIRCPGEDREECSMFTVQYDVLVAPQQFSFHKITMNTWIVINTTDQLSSCNEIGPKITT